MPKLKNLLSTTLIATATLLSGCVAVYDQGGVNSVEELHRLGQKSFRFRSPETVKKNIVRSQMIAEAALSLGAQAGLAWQYRNINAALEENSTKLDNVFNFYALVMPHNVMPPVLLEGHHTLKQENESLIRITDRTYKIKRQAHFVTAPPNWRQYIYQSFKAPELPPHNMLPRNSGEHKIWVDCINKGWQDGLRQAIEIFDSNLARLVEDYRGMVVYRKLLAQGMVTPPYVAKSELGVTGDHESLNVNDQVLRIAVHPHMQTDSSRWNPTLSALELHDLPLYGANMSKFGGNVVTHENDPIVITQHLLNKKDQLHR